jgi:hypothetical protein
MPNATTYARGRQIGQKLHESCQRLGVRVNTHPFCTPPDIESSDALVSWLQAQVGICVELDREIQERDNPLPGTTPHDLDLLAEKLRAAARVFADRKTPQSVKKTATRALYHSGHDESEGEWSDRQPATWFSRVCGFDRRKIIQIFGPTGLIQKTPESWIVKLDGCKPEWAEAITREENCKKSRQ